jgi:hypothetical protein
MFAGFPGISCLATLLSSLRDKGWGPFLTLTLMRGRGEGSAPRCRLRRSGLPRTRRAVRLGEGGSEAALQIRRRIARPNLPA